MKGAPKVIARTSRASGGRVMDPTRRDLLVSSNGRVRRELEPTVNPWVFVTGMFRSGTTLLAIMLQNHSRLRIPTDPLSNLFKAFRNEVASNLQPDRAIDEHTPLRLLFSSRKASSASYHSSNDEPSRLREDDLQQASDTIYRMCRILESDRVYAPKHPVPIYLSRYDLYIDAVNLRSDFKERRSILYGMDGTRSLLEIAAENNVDFDKVEAFTARLIELQLMDDTGHRKW